MKEVSPQNLAVVVYEEAMSLREPIGKRGGAREIALQRIGLAGANHRFENRPDRVVIFGRLEPTTGLEPVTCYLRNSCSTN